MKGRYCDCGADTAVDGIGHCRVHHTNYVTGAGCAECKRELAPLEAEMEKLMLKLKSAEDTEINRLRAEVSALRTRAESAERENEGLTLSALQSQRQADALLKKLHAAERERDEAYAKGQADMRERAALSVWCRIVRFKETPTDRKVNNTLAMCAEAVNVLPIKERPQ